VSLGIRLFLAALVAAFGVGFYAVAALFWDRRRQVPLATGPRSAIVAMFLVIGTILVVGSCAGLFRF
jgi:hypothetical protein